MVEQSALVLIDYQVAMCEEGEHCRLPALAAQVRERAAIDHASAILECARASGVYVVQVRLGFDPSYEVRSNRTARWASYPQERAMLEDSPGAQIVSTLAPLNTEPVVVKASVNPFIGTALTNMLVGKGIRALAIAGVATNLAVESAVRHAGDSGFDVTVIESACASWSATAHDFCVENILPWFATVMSSAEYIAQVERSGAPNR